MGSQPVLSQNEAFARIRLLRSPNIGPVSYRQLLARFGSAGAALDALPDLASRGRGPYRPARAESIEREVAAVRKAGARYLFHDQSDYPALLAELDSAPPNMTCRGRLALGHAPCVALAGARNASAAAVKLARDFGAALAEAGFTVVSVLARGIDGAAHEGAFPNTIGVIASGIDIAYPPQHTALQERNASEAQLIAEQPPGTEPARAAFSFEEPHNRRPRLGHAGGRGRAAIGLADHRAAGGRGGARGDGDPPLPARCARWVAIS